MNPANELALKLSVTGWLHLSGSLTEPVVQATKEGQNPFLTERRETGNCHKPC